MNNPLSVQLYNTYSRKLETLAPVDPDEIKLYCCGPTVYNFQHIGNLKTYVCEDILVRALRYAGYKVKHVMNITDVGHLTSDADEGEDKMAVAMRRENKKSSEIADFYTNKFFEDCGRLNIIRPDVACKATEHIQEMIDLVKRIEENGYAYTSGGNVYFDVSKFKNYGKLAKLDLEKLKAGARIEVDQNKRNPYDFGLWFTQSKFENQELTWESPWGRGYPGWHLECSAMSIKHLGERCDIHCGGIDHIPVHHTNEIAQSEAATGKPWVSIWLHSDFILLNNEKMSKSKGGFMVLDDLIEEGFEPLAFRFLVLTANYRRQLNFSYESLTTASNNLKKLKSTVLDLKKQNSHTGEISTEGSIHQENFCQAILNDLNTPQALAVVWKVLADEKLSADEKLTLLESFDSVFGLGIKDWKEEQLDVPAEVLELVEKRQQARKDKDWAEADRLRDEIKELGFQVKDSANGAEIKKI